jgi:SAM-dependent methyltransferase
MNSSEVQNFYEGPGWKLDNGVTYDAKINENLDLVATDYVHKVRNRIAANLGAGEKLLDVGCGPIQYSEYEDYSKNFEKRICVDLSQTALDLAKKKIGDHGEYIKGDYLVIPTPTFAPYDGAALINVLYHVNKEKQAELVRKILNDLNIGSKLVIVYSNPKTISELLTKISVGVLHFFKRSILRKPKVELENPIYFFRHPNSFWNQFSDGATIKLMAWRTFSPSLEKIFFKQFFGGKAMLRLLFRLEELKGWKNVAQYTLIVLEKNK